MKKIITISVLILSQLFLFSQAKLNIYNGAYLSMNGGTSSSPVYLVVENGNTNAVSRTGSGHIISENEYNKVKWLTGINTGTYQIPLGKDASNYFPFYMNKTTSGDCPVTPCGYTVSSWFTLNNSVWPSGVTTMNPSENSAIDRFWVVNQSGFTSYPSVDVRFYYLTSELDAIPEAKLKSQRWNASTSYWDTSAGTVNTTNDYVEINGATQFSPFALTDSDNPLITAPLPIELLFFTARWENNQQESVILEWTTATEINNDYFVVERSSKGIDFENIGTVKGAGNSSSIHNYNFVDNLITKNSKPETIYYRLKQVDYDGTYSYSNIVAIQGNNYPNTVAVFPNPVTDVINISILASDNCNGEINITNTLSQNVFFRQINVEKEINNYSYNIKHLPKGIYFLKIATENQLNNYKIIIK